MSAQRSDTSLPWSGSLPETHITNAEAGNPGWPMTTVSDEIVFIVKKISPANVDPTFLDADANVYTMTSNGKLEKQGEGS